MALLPRPTDDAEAWVGEHLASLCCDAPAASASHRGGQSAAEAALAGFDVRGYARFRNEVLPPERRGASRLSPYIRHGLLHLRRVWDHVAGGPSRDVRKFRDELLWQEYARHLYARLGARTARPLRFAPVEDPQVALVDGQPDPDGMLCLDSVAAELERDGWLVNQTRMWFASHWAIRRGWSWRDGEDHFFRHLLDGSRAANRLGWQWTAALQTGKAYGFCRWQVEKRAPGLCGRCDHGPSCPIRAWPEPSPLARLDPPVALRHDDDPATTAGPSEVVPGRPPEAVWITAESLGDGDPALTAHPDLPAVFVFDERLLRRLRLSSKRLVFLVECLTDLGRRRELRIALGDPADFLSSLDVAVTFAPVPGHRRLLERLRRRGRRPELHPWPWLAPPHRGSLASFSAWRRHLRMT